MRKGPGGSRRARSAGSGPGPGPVAVPVPLPGPGLCPRSRRCPRPLLPLLALAAAAAALLYVAWPGGERGTGPVSGGEGRSRWVSGRWWGPGEGMSCISTLSAGAPTPHGDPPDLPRGPQPL